MSRIDNYLDSKNIQLIDYRYCIDYKNCIDYILIDYRLHIEMYLDSKNNQLTHYILNIHQIMCSLCKKVLIVCNEHIGLNSNLNNIRLHCYIMSMLLNCYKQYIMESGKFSIYYLMSSNSNKVSFYIRYKQIQRNILYNKFQE